MDYDKMSDEDLMERIRAARELVQERRPDGFDVYAFLRIVDGYSHEKARKVAREVAENRRR